MASEAKSPTCYSRTSAAKFSTSSLRILNASRNQTDSLLLLVFYTEIHPRPSYHGRFGRKATGSAGFAGHKTSKPLRRWTTLRHTHSNGGCSSRQRRNLLANIKTTSNTAIVAARPVLRLFHASAAITILTREGNPRAAGRVTKAGTGNS